MQATVNTGLVALTASATKSLILLNPVTAKAKLTAWKISLDGSALAQGLKFEPYRVVTLGSAAGTTGTINNTDVSDQTPTTTALTALTVEPTTVTVLDGFVLQQVGGLYVLQGPLGREEIIMAPAGARVGIRAVAPAGISTNVEVTAYFEE